MKKDEEVFETQNLYQAAYLMCHGFKFVGKRDDGRKVTVIFKGKDIEKIAFDFYNGAKVDAKLLTDSYRSLKDAVFSR